MNSQPLAAPTMSYRWADCPKRAATIFGFLELVRIPLSVNLLKVFCGKLEKMRLFVNCAKFAKITLAIPFEIGIIGR